MARPHPCRGIFLLALLVLAAECAVGVQGRNFTRLLQVQRRGVQGAGDDCTSVPWFTLHQGMDADGEVLECQARGGRTPAEMSALCMNRYRCKAFVVYPEQAAGGEELMCMLATFKNQFKGPIPNWTGSCHGLFTPSCELEGYTFFEGWANYAANSAYVWNAGVNWGFLGGETLQDVVQHCNSIEDCVTFSVVQFDPQLVGHENSEWYLGKNVSYPPSRFLPGNFPGGHMLGACEGQYVKTADVPSLTPIAPPADPPTAPPSPSSQGNDCSVTSSNWAENQCCEAGGNITRGSNSQVDQCRSCVSTVGAGKEYACIDCTKSPDSAVAAACTQCVISSAASNGEWACKDCLRAGSTEDQQACIQCLGTGMPSWQCLQRYVHT